MGMNEHTAPLRKCFIDTNLFLQHIQSSRWLFLGKILLISARRCQNTLCVNYISLENSRRVVGLTDLVVSLTGEQMKLCNKKKIFQQQQSSFHTDVKIRGDSTQSLLFLKTCPLHQYHYYYYPLHIYIYMIIIIITIIKERSSQNDQHFVSNLEFVYNNNNTVTNSFLETIMYVFHFAK